MKHWIIANKLGHDGPMETVKESFQKGLVSKEDFAATLRGHQAAVDATKSPQGGGRSSSFFGYFFVRRRLVKLRLKCFSTMVQ